MKDFDDGANGVRQFIGDLVNSLSGHLALDKESRSILEVHYLRAQAEILTGYQEVIKTRLNALENQPKTGRVDIE